MSAGRAVVYTDGACLGNPGPGGWAWAVPGGRWRSGAEARTTNQRMEITAALDAARQLEGRLEVVSDSTYVVNCFRREWWKRWVANGWVSTARQPVANKDLWEPLVELYRAAPGRLEFRWVKGHGTDPFNDLVDRLAVTAATRQRGGEGDHLPDGGAGGGGSATEATSPLSVVGLPAGRAVDTLGAGGGASAKRGRPALRPGRRSDAEALAELWRQAGARPGRTDDLASIRALVAHDPAALVVAEAEGRVVGSVIAAFDGWRANLYRLAVDPAWRRQGVASALVAEAEQRLVARGAKRASATVVDQDARAVEFWAAAGYLPQKGNTRYVKDL